MNETMNQLQVIFQEVFGDDEIVVARTTQAADVEGWDSLMHAILILNVEKAFKVKFSSSEVASLKSVGELADLVDGKRPRA